MAEPEAELEESGESLLGALNVSSCGMPPSGDSARLLPADRLPPISDPGPPDDPDKGGGLRELGEVAVEPEPEEAAVARPHDLGRMDSM